MRETEGKKESRGRRERNGKVRESTCRPGRREIERMKAREVERKSGKK